MDEKREVKIHVSVGSWPVEVFVYEDQIEKYVGIYSDHNTDDYYTRLDRNQILELRDALTRWLDDGGR